MRRFRCRSVLCDMIIILRAQVAATTGLYMGILADVYFYMPGQDDRGYPKRVKYDDLGG